MKFFEAPVLTYCKGGYIKISDVSVYSLSKESFLTVKDTIGESYYSWRIWEGELIPIAPAPKALIEQLCNFSWNFEVEVRGRGIYN